jgi:hypothetical protein
MTIKVLELLKKFHRKPQLNNRTELLNHLAQRFGYESYLEIGCSSGKNFEKITGLRKVGVDPKQGGTFRGTSDRFFAQNQEMFDLIFVDGLHHSEQVLVDVENSLRVLNRRGAIVLHDCNPLSERAQRVPRETAGGTWNGDVWRAALALRMREDLDAAVANFDHGCGIVLCRSNTDQLVLEENPFSVSYELFHANRDKWLRLLTASQVRRFLNGY